MQDWNYAKTFSNFEVTIELGDSKWPPANTLQSYWEDNKYSLEAFLRKVHQGVRGKITNTLGEPVRSIVEIVGIDHPIINREDGWYFRPLVPGDYTLRVSSIEYPDILEEQVTIESSLDFKVINFIIHIHNIYSFKSLKTTRGITCIPMF